MLQQPTALQCRRLEPKPCSCEELLGAWSLLILQRPQGLRPGEQLPALPSRSQQQGPSTVLQELHRQAITPQHLPLSDGRLSLLGSLNVMRQALPAREDIRGHGIQHHHPIQPGMAMHSCQLLRYPATPPIPMGTK